MPRIHGVKIEAEMKTPSLTTVLPVSFASSASPPTDDQSYPATPPPSDLSPAASLQGIITYHLKEEGPHVLAVTVSYSETSSTSGRIRSFRKLYQFVARPALVVRTKIGTIKEGWALEAQLENVGEETLVLEGVTLETKEWCKARSLEELWKVEYGEDGEKEDVEEAREKSILGRGGVHQACFLVERAGKAEEAEGGRLYMGVLNISWRGPMGNIGELSTGWLGVKAR